MRDQHTPGPWEWRWSDCSAGLDYPELFAGDIRILYADSPLIMSGHAILSEAPGDEAQANARLLAAAYLLPEVWEVLGEIHAYLYESDETGNPLPIDFTSMARNKAETLLARLDAALDPTDREED